MKAPAPTARRRLPESCLRKALADSAASADRLSIHGVPGWSRPVKVVDRVVVKGFRTKELWISTTLLDPVAYPAERIARLYLRRWDMELCFRDLKTTLGMEELRCRTPAMVRKELLAFLVAHNFIRCLVAEAATNAHVPRDRISFKGTVDAARSFHAAMRRVRSKHKNRQLRQRLLEIIARALIPLRPGRCEPRAAKRRPKPYIRLTKPRHLYRETPHRGKRRIAA